MKCFVLLSLCALSLAKPQGKLVTETEGRIIGGEEAPKRKLRKIKLFCCCLATSNSSLKELDSIYPDEFENQPCKKELPVLINIIHQLV